MQDLVGIVRTEHDMQQALKEIDQLKQRAAKTTVHGNREYNAGWHTALDLGNLLTVSEAITKAAIERKESRGGHFREDYQGKDKTFGELNIIVRRGPGGEMLVVREKIPPLPAELEQIIKEQQQ
jgi:succinate dehydrogenase / fumarate reductase flavoprotein subunit